MNLNKPLTLTRSVSIVLIVLAGCRSAPPKVDVKLWAGDSERAGVTRSQTNETIACTDPAIDGLVCLSYADLKKLMDVIWSCEKWPATLQKMDRRGIDEALRLYSMISRKAYGAQLKSEEEGALRKGEDDRLEDDRLD